MPKRNRNIPAAFSLGDTFLLKLKDKELGSLGDYYPNKLTSDGYPLPGYMFYGGGYSAGTISNVQRLDTQNDTYSVNRGIFSYRKSEFGGSGNSNYAWYTGGRNPAVGGVGALSSIQRIDYANDLEGTSNRGSLDVARRTGNNLTGNSNYAWSSGGYNGSYLSSTSRIDYNADLSTGSPRGNLSSSRSSHTATGTATYGWTTGGETFPTYYSFVDRITYSSDLSTGSPRSNLAVIRSNHASICDGTYFWTAGGNNYTTNYSSVDRTTIASDLSTATVRCNLAGGDTVSTAFKNTTYGWWAGTGYPGTQRAVDRMTLSSDLSTATRFTNTSPVGTGSPGHSAFNI